MRVSLFLLACTVCAGRRVNLPADETSGTSLDALLLALNRLPVVRAPRVSPAIASEKIAFSDLSKGAKVEGKVTNVVQFGAFVDIGAEKDALLHVSGMTEFTADANDKFKVGDTVSAFIKAIDPEKGQISLSEKEGDQTSVPGRKQVDVSEFENADEKAFIKGVVKRIADFGAFVGLKDGVDGLLHISQLSKDRVEQVSDVLSVGDEVDVRVIEFDANGPRISLSMIPWEEGRAAAPRSGGNPNAEYENADPKEFIKGEVVRVTDFGAFVRLKPGVDGLLHISQLGEDRVESVTDVVNEGDMVDVRVVSADQDRISLSMLPYNPEDDRYSFDATDGLSEEAMIRISKIPGRTQVAEKEIQEAEVVLDSTNDNETGVPSIQTLFEAVFDPPAQEVAPPPPPAEVEYPEIAVGDEFFVGKLGMHIEEEAHLKQGTKGVIKEIDDETAHALVEFDGVREPKWIGTQIAKQLKEAPAMA